MDLDGISSAGITSSGAQQDDQQVARQTATTTMSERHLIDLLSLNQRNGKRNNEINNTEETSSSVGRTMEHDSVTAGKK